MITLLSSCWLLCILSNALVFGDNFVNVGGCVFQPGKTCGVGEQLQQCTDCHNVVTKTLRCYKHCPQSAIADFLENAIVPDGYTQWSEWTSCTGTCGQGIRYQTRECLDDGNSCDDDLSRSEDCELGECSLESCDMVPNGVIDMNFEDCQENLSSCGNWTWSLGQWIITSGETKSKGTGPKYDSTFKKGCGKYIHFEASLSSNSGNRILSTNELSPSDDESCLSFELSMYSARPVDMGSLIVMVEGSKHTLFNRSGGIGSRQQGWEPVRINIPSSDVPYKITFKVVGTKGYQSDVAIDDIIFNAGIKCDSGVDGNWGSWEEWSTDCVSDCGIGEISRERYCNSPTHTNDGLPCIGHNEEMRICKNLKPCPVNGLWADWIDVKDCSESCGTDVKLQKRECTKQHPIADGKECLLNGEDDEYGMSEYQLQDCELPNCPEALKSPCPAGWKEFRVHLIDRSVLNCYKFSETEENYETAKKICNEMTPRKSYLTSIESQSENDFLKGESDGDFFIGIKRTQSGFYEWTDSSPFGYNNIMSSEEIDCSYVNMSTGKWFSHDCVSSDVKHYVCKVEADLWNPWSAFSDCSTTCNNGQGFKIRSRTCDFPTEGLPYECTPNDRRNMKNDGDVINEYEYRECYGRTSCENDVTTTETPTPAPAETHSWLEWSNGIDVGNIIQVRACSGAGDDNGNCDQTESDVLYSTDNHVEIKIIPEACGEGWEEMVSLSNERTCWHYSNTTAKTFDEAVTYCANIGGELASIISSEEQNFVMSILPAYDGPTNQFTNSCPDDDSCSYWLGASLSMYGAGFFQWSDNTYVGYTHFYEGMNLLTTAADDGLVLDVAETFKWRNYNKANTKQALCKKQITPRLCSNEVDASVVFVYRVGDECFHVIEQQRNFEEANALCMQLNLTLASVNNLDVQLFLNSLLFGAEIYLGGYVVTDGMPSSGPTGLWMDGTYWSPFTYFGGAPGGVMPDSATLGNCIATDATNGWRDVDCTSDIITVCKEPLVPTVDCPEDWERLITPNGVQCYYIGEPYGGIGMDSSAIASKVCESKGANLAKLDDSYERAFVFEMVKNATFSSSPISFRLGLEATAADSALWYDGEEADVNMFGAASPTFPKCGYIANDFSGIEFESCDAPAHFICQKYDHASIHQTVALPAP